VVSNAVHNAFLNTDSWNAVPQLVRNGNAFLRVPLEMTLSTV